MSVRRVLGVVVVVICVAAPIVEAFDSWDHTLQDRNDTEANLVVAAVCIGIALTFGTPFLVRHVRSLRLVARVQPASAAHDWSSYGPFAIPTPAASPPLARRI